MGIVELFSESSETSLVTPDASCQIKRVPICLRNCRQANYWRHLIEDTSRGRKVAQQNWDSSSGVMVNPPCVGTCIGAGEYTVFTALICKRPVGTKAHWMGSHSSWRLECNAALFVACYPQHTDATEARILMVRESMILEMMAALLKCLARRSELAARYLEPDSREDFSVAFF